MTTSQAAAQAVPNTPAPPAGPLPENAAKAPTTTQVLNYLLQRAAHAHHFHELELGGPHANWPPWYAGHMAETLALHGYRLVLATDRTGVDVHADPTEGVAEEAEAKKSAP